MNKMEVQRSVARTRRFNTHGLPGHSSNKGDVIEAGVGEEQRVNQCL
jgi:hypothetical protein